MKKKINLGEFFGNLLRNNNFLKLLSVLLALIVWIYILYIVNPVNELVFDRVEVSLAYEGSVPDRNGFMYLMTDTNLTVSVTVTGSRSDLYNLSKEDLKASLNMDSVISAGTYNIGVSVLTDNSDISITDVYPKTFTIEFAEQATRTIPVELQTSGTLPDGYLIDNTAISPKEITVTGPANTVSVIDKALINVSLTNVKSDISGAYDIALVNAAGENIDRKYLTLSEWSAETELAIRYRKILPTAIGLINTSGGDESSYITVTLDTESIQATGPEKVLGGLTEYSVGQLDTSAIFSDTELTLTIPKAEGTTLNTDKVTVKVDIAEGVSSKEIPFSNFSCINIPAGKAAIVPPRTLNIRIRARAEDLGKLSASNLSCLIDMSEANEDGSYPVLVTSTSGISFGILGSYSVEVIVQ